MLAIVITYIIGGLTRGTVLYGLTTVIIQMNNNTALIKYNLTKGVTSLLSVACLLGSIVSTILAPKLIGKIGKTNTLRFVSFLSLVANILIFPAIHWAYLFVFKSIAGFATVLLITVVPLIGVEQLDPKIRGVVGSLTNVTLQGGMFISYIIQYFISSQDRFYPLSVVLPTILSIAMIGMSFIIKERKQEVSETTNTVVVQPNITKINIWQKKYTKSFIVAISLGMSIGATGSSPILQYSTLIFKNSFNSPKSGTIGAIIMSGISFIAALAALPVVRRYKRKTIFTIGLNIILCCYIIMITVMYVKPAKKVSDAIILATTIVFIISYAFSSGSLFFVIMGEVFPPQIKSIFVNMSMAINQLTLLITTFIFPLLKQQENYILYFCWVVLVEVLIIKFVPETHNKLLSQIEFEMIPNNETNIIASSDSTAQFVLEILPSRLERCRIQTAAYIQQ
ncbi:Sugar_(And other) transporter family protein [Hexamita inflata]|uniref:Sugar (And other) transporter family protein n=1 Tax=Hexamita inflata TaxID=28002 RepID=A0AA86TSE3_9EUKA|nr:Sugar (And other) transporter family protein [Hexamita inflata]CAI9960663.1 Sugar (And other) transporter family protein [Hexamita inflata]